MIAGGAGAGEGFGAVDGPASAFAWFAAAPGPPPLGSSGIPPGPGKYAPLRVLFAKSSSRFSGAALGCGAQAASAY